MKTYRVSIYKEARGVVEIEADNEDDALERVQRMLDDNEESLSVWGPEQAEAECAEPKGTP
jgi:hypothetical protein